MCRHNSIRRDAIVCVILVFRGNNVPFTCDNSKSGIKGLTQQRARKPIGLHHGTKIPRRNIIFHIQHHVLCIRFSNRQNGQRVLVARTVSFSTKNTGWLGSDRGVTIDVTCWQITVGITSDWPWKLRRMIHDFGDHIRHAHWKLLVGVFALHSSFFRTGSRWNVLDTFISGSFQT